MKEQVTILELDNYELGILINALNDFRNKLIIEKSSTEDIDDLLLKTLDSKEKKKFLKFKERVFR